MKVFVIIVTYNAMPWIDRCINSILNSTIPLDIIVIDNGSKDGTQQYIKQNFKDILIIESNTNLGFGKANNMGIKYALENNADYVYLLNQDAWVDRNTIEFLTKLIRENPQYGIISPMQIEANRKYLDKNFEYICSSTSCPKLISNLYFNECKELYEVKFVMAAHWLISKNCLNKVGGFAPIFHQYGEDDNYIQRTQYHGFKIGISPYVCGVHDRALRKTNKQKELASLSSIYLAHICNINDNFSKAFLKSYYYLLRMGVGIMVKYKTLLGFKYFTKALIYIPSVISTRKKTKETGQNYLTTHKL